MILQGLREFVERRKRNKVPENLNAVVDEAITLGRVRTAHTSVAVHRDFDPTIPPVLMDKVQIQQVLVNLFRNAIEAMEGTKHPELTITTRIDKDGCAEVAVGDTGSGLSENIRRRLFQPFATSKDSGMGVGLCISQSIIDAHGGRIWTKQDASPGTTFFFRLPLASNVRNAA